MTILIPQALSFAFPAQLKERNRKIKSEEHLGRTPPRTQKKKDSCLFPYGSHGYDTRIAQAYTHTVSTQAASLSSERPSLFHALNWSELHYSRLALSSAETHWVHFNSFKGELLSSLCQLPLLPCRYMYCGIIHMPVEQSCHYFIFSVIAAPHPADAGCLIFSKEPPNCHIPKERWREGGWIVFKKGGSSQNTHWQLERVRRMERERVKELWKGLGAEFNFFVAKDAFSEQFALNAETWLIPS